MKTLPWLFAFVFLFTVPLAASTLRVGDPAPSLSVTKWVQGEEVSLEDLREKKVVIVEFWATWCRPCIAAMPHLTEIQKKHEDDVVVVGVSRPDRNNSLEKVETFVKENGDRMGYRVAFDGDSATYKAFMTASAQRGIPTSFVIDKSGTLAWIGHPMRLDSVLEKIVAGKFDIELAALKSTLEKRLSKQQRNRDDEGALRTLGALTALISDDPGVWQLALFTYLRMGKEAKSIEAAKQSLKVAETADDLVRLARLLGRLPDEAYHKVALEAARKAVELKADDKAVNMALFSALALLGEKKEITPVAERVFKLAENDAAILNHLAWDLLTAPAIEGSFDELALKVAAQCHKVSEGSNWAYLDTYALAQFRAGKKKEAFELQTKAVELAEKSKIPEDTLGDMKKALKKYAGASSVDL